MYGNDSLPSCIYAYDVADKKDLHISDLDYCFTQLWLANQYRKKLVEVELKRRKLLDELRKQSYPDYQQREDEINFLENKIEEIRKQIKQQNINNKSKNNENKKKKEEIKD